MAAGNAMKLKLDANGNAVLVDGPNGTKLPVYVHDDGKEAPFDAAATVASLNSRTEQNTRVENENKELKANLKKFSVIEDPEKALKALQMVKDLDHGKLVDAGQVQRIRDEVAAGYEAKLTEANGENEGLKKRLTENIIGTAFAGSKVISDKFAIPSDLVRARFGQHFGVENDKVYATDAAGNRIFSRTKPAELAEFDEALMLLVEQYPYKDHILKGTGAKGGGASSSAAAGGKRVVTRSQFEQMDPVEQSNIGRSKDVVLVDG